jgi:hypothetical protein
VPYSISTPEGRVVANQMTRKIPVELVGRVFSTALIILEGCKIPVELVGRVFSTALIILEGCNALIFEKNRIL